MAFMMEAENFNPWIESAQGYLSQCLHDYEKNPVWTADPKRTPYRDVAKRSLTPGGIGSVGEKAAAAIADFVVLDMFANFCTGREDVKGACHRRAAGEAHLPLRRLARAAAARRLPGRDALVSLAKRSDAMADATRQGRRRHGRCRRSIRRLEPARSRTATGSAIWFMLPAAAFLILFLAYPLGLGVWLSFTDARIGRARRLRRPRELRMARDDSIFWLSVFNTLLYTIVASIIKFARRPLSRAAAQRHLPFKAMIRAVVLIPFIVPTVLSAIAFWWIFDTQFSIISWSLKKIGLITTNIDFLGDAWNARGQRDLRQYLARRAVRRHHAAGRPADRLALALRGRDDRRRHPLADASASSPIRC